MANIKIRYEYGEQLMRDYGLTKSAVKSLVEKRQEEMMNTLEKNLVKVKREN